MPQSSDKERVKSADVMAFLGPERGFERREVAVAPLEPGAVLARVRLATICGSDLHTRAGRRHVEVPSVLGHEIVAEVVATGGPVFEWRHGAPSAAERGAPLGPGERIVWSLVVDCGRCATCRRGLPQKCERLFKYGHSKMEVAPLSGGLGSLVRLVPGTRIVRVPDALDDRAAAPASCATATVAAAFRRAESRGGRVLVLGTGLLGLTACAFGRERGERVTAIDPAADRRARALAFGADEALAPAELSADARFDLVLELSGQPSALVQGAQALAIGGAMVLVGSVFPSAPWPLDPEALVRRCATVHGLHNYAPEDLRTAVDFLAGPGARYPFADAVLEVHALKDIDLAFERAAGSGAPRVGVRP